MTVSNPTNKPAASSALSLKLRFYRQCRLWHGYLSAFAFAALLFFAVTGVLLNHPTWFAAKAPAIQSVNLRLTPAQLAAVRAAEEPAQALTRIVSDQMPLLGMYDNGATVGEQIFARLTRGSSDIRATLSDGSVLVTMESATTIAVLNALHRGEQAGAAWRTYIDVAAVALILVALAGFAIFFSMAARLQTTLLITGSSLLGTVVLFLTLVK
jgi:hypothetical protein